jgi:tetratricopeptide (TPR) repeat protein
MAEKEFQAVLTEDPKNAESLYMLGEIEWMRAKPHEALDLYDRALEVRPAFVDAQIAAGKALNHLGRTDEALKHLSEAIHLDPKSEVAHYRLYEAYLKLRRTQDAERELAAFRTLRNSHDSAKSLYQQVQGDSVRQQVVAPSEPQ